MEIKKILNGPRCFRCFSEENIFDYIYLADYGVRIEARLCNFCSKEFNELLNGFFKKIWVTAADI